LASVTKSQCGKRRRANSRFSRRSTPTTSSSSRRSTLRISRRDSKDIRIPQLGAATQAKYETLLRKHILPAFGESMLCEITRPAIESWLNQKASDGLSWNTRTDLRNLLSGIFNQAIQWKLWDERNPCQGVAVGGRKWLGLSVSRMRQASKSFWKQFQQQPSSPPTAPGRTPVVPGRYRSAENGAVETGSPDRRSRRRIVGLGGE
jgi:hypothetical protein